MRWALVIVSLFGVMTLNASPQPHALSSIFANVFGKGRPVVFLAGISCNSSVWNDTVRRLPEGFQAHLLHVRGFGGNAPDHPMSLRRVVSDTIAYVEEEKLEKPVFVGHSMGGVVGLAIAAERPDLLGGLVVVDAVPRIPFDSVPVVGEIDPGALAAFIRENLQHLSRGEFLLLQNVALELMSPKGSEPREEIQRMVEQSSPRSVVSVLADLIEVDLRPVLGRITCPVLLINGLGDKSHFLSRNAAERLIRAEFAGIPGAQLEILPDAGHFVMLDEPVRFSELLNAFLLKKRL